MCKLAAKDSYSIRLYCDKVRWKDTWLKRLIRAMIRGMIRGTFGGGGDKMIRTGAESSLCAHQALHLSTQTECETFKEKTIFRHGRCMPGARYFDKIITTSDDKDSERVPSFAAERFVRV